MLLFLNFYHSILRELNFLGGIGNYCTREIFKVAVSRDLLAIFYFRAQNKQIITVFLKNSFLRKYSNFKFEKIYST